MAQCDAGSVELSTAGNAQCISARAPAKINLGLEILGKRRDGFHEIRSILAMVDVNDDIRFSFDTPAVLQAIDGVPAELDLIGRAIGLFQAHLNTIIPLNYIVEKRIPVAAGLGGASSDAAATLEAINRLYGHPLTQNQLNQMASNIGSDVPFFLGSPAAFIKGTGTEIEPIPPLSGGVVLIVPHLGIARKTETLYSRITERDYSQGHRIERTVRRLSGGLPPDPPDLANAFMDPLYDLVPSLAGLPKTLQNAGCTSFGLSGAGPAHYALVEPSEVPAVVTRLELELDRRRFRIIKTSFLAKRNDSMLI